MAVWSPAQTAAFWGVEGALLQIGREFRRRFGARPKPLRSGALRMLFGGRGRRGERAAFAGAAARQLRWAGTAPSGFGMNSPALLACIAAPTEFGSKKLSVRCLFFRTGAERLTGGLSFRRRTLSTVG